MTSSPPPFGSLRVHLGFSPSPILLQELGWEGVSFDEEPPRDSQVLVQGRPEPAVLDRLTNLRAVIVPWAGIPPATLALLRDRPHLSLYNLHHNARPVAEHAMALILACARRLRPLDLHVREHGFLGREAHEEPPLLAECRVAVLGAGAIGQEFKRMAAPVFAEISLVGRSARPGVTPWNSVESVLTQSSILVCTLPLTPQTEGLVRRNHYEAMRAPRIVVNVGRGAVLHEEDLYRSLRDGILHSAGLDVWYRSPGDGGLPWNQPFESLPNLIATPHVAGDSTATERLRGKALRQLLFGIQTGTASPIRLSEGY